MQKRVSPVPGGRPVVTEMAGVTVTRVGVNLGAEITGVAQRLGEAVAAFRGAPWYRRQEERAWGRKARRALRKAGAA